MGDVQQQIADGARPLARVGDVIEHGQDIPANVVRLQDAQRGPDRFWVRTMTDPLSFDYRWPGSRRAPGRSAEDIGDVPSYFPMTVVEVDPEPQPAEDDGMPERQCATEARHGAHAWPGAYGKAWCPGYVGRAGVDVDGFLRLKGTATGDNQLDPEPQPADPAPSGLCEVGPDRVNCIVPDATHRQIYHGGRPVIPEPQPGPQVFEVPPLPDAVTRVRYIGELSGTTLYAEREPGADTWIISTSGIPVTLARLHGLALGGRLVDATPKREPRTWPRFPELTPEELEALPWTVDLTLANGAVMRWVCPEDSIFFEHEGNVPRTLLSLRELGEVLEVLEP